ncbi:hypothetical protein MPC1_4860001 [Methylocella tundrae]|nr:hypothetical protein MPC1_4860001 [Methylocella tundrae]
MYTAETRATGQTHTMIARAAVLGAVRRTMALGDATPITDEDLWDRVARDTSEKPYKALGIDLAAKARGRQEDGVSAGLGSHHKIDTAGLSTTDIGRKIRAAFDAGAARDAFARRREDLETLLQRAAEALRQAAQLAKDHLAGRRASAPDGGPRPGPAAATPAPRRSPPSPGR